MHDFCYVSRKSAALERENITKLIFKVQKIVREHFTFTFSFVGSSSRNMITFDKNSNVGYDFDVNIIVNNRRCNDAKRIKLILKDAQDKIAPKFGYDFCEDSTRVLTIKQVDRRKSRIMHSCDFAILTNKNGIDKYILFDKVKNTYTWERQGGVFLGLYDKVDYLRRNGTDIFRQHNMWQEVRDLYIQKKNNNEDLEKHSRSIFAETVNEIYIKYHKEVNKNE